METMKSGLQKPGGTDAVNREWHLNNLAVLNNKLRLEYREKIDTTTWDADAKVYTTVEYLRPEDGSKYARCVLSNKDGSNHFLTDTWTIYAADGVTVVGTITWTLTYGNGNIVVDKVPVVTGVV